MTAQTQPSKLPWPQPPKGRDNFYHSIGLLDPMLCEQQEVRLSKYTRIVKVWNVGSRIGKALLGEAAIQASNDLRKHDWNDLSFKSIEGSHTIHAAFPHLGARLGGEHTQYYRRFDQADSAIEVRFARNTNMDANKMQEIAGRDLQTAVTALRLLRLSGVGLIGPVAIIAHAPSGIGSGMTFGNPSDPILARPRGAPKVLQLRRSDCAEVRRIFRALERKLPGPVQLALGRLNLSTTRSAVEDRIVDAVVGLEAIYLTKESAELSYRLAIRISAHQEPDAKGRMDLFNKVRFLYDVRSRLVHGGIEKLSTYGKFNSNKHFSNEIELVDFARDILRQGCKSVVMDLSRAHDWKTYHQRMDNAALSGATFG